MKIRYFFIQDKIVAEGFTVEYSPISGMLADYYTKPVQCTTFGKYFNLKVRIRKSAGQRKILAMTYHQKSQKHVGKQANVPRGNQVVQRSNKELHIQKLR